MYGVVVRMHKAVRVLIFDRQEFEAIDGIDPVLSQVSIVAMLEEDVVRCHSLRWLARIVLNMHETLSTVDAGRLHRVNTTRLQGPQEPPWPSDSETEACSQPVKSLSSISAW